MAWRVFFVVCCLVFLARSPLAAAEMPPTDWAPLVERLQTQGVFKGRRKLLLEGKARSSQRPDPTSQAIIEALGAALKAQGLEPVQLEAGIAGTGEHLALLRVDYEPQKGRLLVRAQVVDFLTGEPLGQGFVVVQRPAQSKSQPQPALRQKLLALDPRGGNLGAEESRHWGDYLRQQLSERLPHLAYQPTPEEQTEISRVLRSDCAPEDCAQTLGRELGLAQVLAVQVVSYEDPSWGMRHQMTAHLVEASSGRTQSRFEVHYRGSRKKFYRPLEDLVDQIEEQTETPVGAAEKLSGGLEAILGQIDQFELRWLPGGPALYITDSADQQQKRASYWGNGFMAKAHSGKYSASFLYQSGSYAADPEYDDQFSRPFTGSCTAYQFGVERNWYSGSDYRGWMGVVGLGIGQTYCRNRFDDTGASFDVNSNDFNLILDAGYVWGNGVLLGVYLPGNFGSAEMGAEAKKDFEEVSAPTHSAFYLGYAF